VSKPTIKATGASDWFRRLLLPGLAFKAVVIGGGYATGRELAEFFMASGPWGGLLAMLCAAVTWSLVSALTFYFGYVTQSFDYRSFFRHLLGPMWGSFEAAFALCTVVALSVYGAAAGAIGKALFDWPAIAGTVGLMGVVTAFAAFGNDAVERLFKYVSFLLYGVYIVFFVLAFTTFGDEIAERFAKHEIGPGWAVGGLSYAGYNLIGAVVILPVVRHMRGAKDAVVAGLLAGPLAMAPAFLFFICMAGFPELKSSELPSDALLSKLGHPAFRMLFQVMIFSALVESSTGLIHAVNQRVASAIKGELSLRWRIGISSAVLTICMLIAARFGLVTLIASGYRLLALVLFVTYIIPLLTVGLFKLASTRSPPRNESHLP